MAVLMGELKPFLWRNIRNTAELQWLEHLWNHENLFKLMSVNITPGQEHNRDIY